MKLLISSPEILQAVADMLHQKGFPNVVTSDLQWEYHREGEYEDSCLICDGISVEIKDK